MNGIRRFLVMAPILALGLIAVLIVLVAVRDGGGTQPLPAADESRDLRIPLRAEALVLDPQRAAVATDLGVVRELFRGLLWYDTSLNLVPMVARELPTQKNGGISKDGLVYTLRLRQGLLWSDGKPLTAADFEYTIKRIFDPSVGSVRAAAYYDIKGAERYNTCKGCSPDELARLRDEVGVKALEDTTLVITLKNPRSTLPYFLAEPAFFPVRRDVIEKHGNAWTDPANFVGNGPFTVKERVPKERLVLQPNSHWWGTQSRVRTVVFKVIPDALDAFNAYLAGEIDVVEVPPDRKPSVDQDPILAKQNVKMPLLQTLGFFFNNQMRPFDNAKVRQAFALALDRDGFVANVLQGVGRATYSWLPPASPGHSDELGVQWKLSAVKARATLAEAGYPDGKGLPSITFPYQNSGLNKAYAEFLQNQLRENLGVEIQLVPMEPRAWTDAFLRREHMMVFVPWTFGADAEASVVEIFGCQKYEGTRCTQFPGNNIAQYSNPEVDRIMQLAAKEPDPKRRATHYSRAEAIIVADVPAAFMLNTARNLLVKPEVQDLVTTPLDSLFPGQYFLERAYIARDQS